MKTLLSIALVVLLGTAGFSQDTEGAELNTASGAFINFDEKSKDFGDITQGDKVSHTFTFTNSGDAPLILSNVKTTCGCTASSWPREPIAPGASSKIDVTFNSAGKVGHQNKVITIMSNASNNPERVKIVTNILIPETEN